MAINQEFWLPREQTYGALKWAQPVGIVSPRMDVLGLALVLLHDIASADRAQKVMAQYPHSTQGAPVIWPQVPDIPIYHNRAIWPFVSSLWMLAAKKHNHSSIVHHNLMTLVRGTALNLSNMENFEFLTLANFYADGNFSGPVVNSARQLWSVAGYMAGVVKGLFGVTFKNDILEMDPFIAETTRRELFEESKDLELRGIVVKGKIFDIRLFFPTQKAALQGSYKKQLILLNGRKIFGNKVKLEEFKESQRNQLVVYLGAFDSSPTPWTLLPDHRPPLSETVVNSLWAPEEPLVSSLEFQKDGEHLRIVSVEKRNLDYVIYRNGEYVARIPRQSNTTEWVDNQVPDNRGDLYCYSVFSVDRDFNLWSFPSQPKCIAAKNRALHFHRFSPENGQLKSLDNARLSQKHGRLHFENWGLPGQELLISGFTPSVSGTYSLTWEYGNAHAPISTGVTAGVKKLVIQEKGSQQTVSTLVFFFPQLNSWDNWGQSNRQNVELKANGNYDFYLVDLFNMTYLDHFKLYTANPGGYEGPLNRVNISHLEMWLEHH
jgi:hypothetical protein